MKLFSALVFAFLLHLFSLPCAAQQASAQHGTITVDLSNIKNLEELQHRVLEIAQATTENIPKYTIDVAIHADSTLDVTETIQVAAKGIQIRRGIYRDFPTRYTDRFGNNMVVGFDVIDLQRDGKPEPWFTEHLNNGTRVNFGNDDFLPVPNVFTYVLRYRTNRQIGFFQDHDELYWNAIGTGWDFPIEQAAITVHLPEAVPVAELKAEGYTGAQGAVAQNYSAFLPKDGTAQWALTQRLYPHEGFTIVLSFPKGIITPPSFQQRALWFMHDNRGVVLGLVWFILMFCYLYWKWLRVGRDPAPGIIITRYYPPEGFSPAALRFIKQMQATPDCLTVDLVELAVKGHLEIHQQKKTLAADQWTLKKLTPSSPEPLPDSQRALMETLFEGGDELVISRSKRMQLIAAQMAQAKVLNKAYKGHMFNHNLGVMGYPFLTSFAVMGYAVYLSAGASIPALFFLCFALFILFIVFASIMAAPTQEGRKLLDEMDGLKRYLTVAERDELAQLQGPQSPPTLDAKRYEFLLPYAMALDAADAWTKKFSAAVGDAMAQQTASSMGWYHGSSGLTSLSQLSSGISSMSTSIASSSSSPGSSSGSGGGGSSGGGGGGGGGGGR